MSLRHYIVSGRVQGVGFRQYVEKQATNYSISGVVRNLEDGRVEFFAKGTDESLEEFERAVRRGPMLSAVRELTSKTLEKPEGLDQDWSTGIFKIADDGVRPWAEHVPSRKSGDKKAGGKTAPKTEPKAEPKTAGKSTAKNAKTPTKTTLQSF